MSFFSLFLIAFYVNNCAKLIKSSDSTLIWKRFLQETWYFMVQAQSYNPSFHFLKRHFRKRILTLYLGKANAINRDFADDSRGQVPAILRHISPHSSFPDTEW